MQRRQFLKTALASSILAGTGALTGCSSAKTSALLDSTIVRLESLKQRQLHFDGPWQAFETFSHLAQSIEYSLTGFPEHKSNGFKSWIGRPAFAVFKAMGAMQHDTAEAIPGAPALRAGVTQQGMIDLSIQRTIVALRQFEKQTKLHPHFAYGELSHEDYLLAHVFHINDHLALLN